MDWIKAEEATFFGAVWLLATLVAFFRGYSRNVTRVDEPFRVAFFSSGLAGFLAFAVVSVLVGRNPDRITGHWYYLGVSAVIGMAGPYQQRIVEVLLSKLGAIGAAIQDGEVDNKAGED